MKSVGSYSNLSFLIWIFSAKIRTIDDTMLHRRLGTILSYVTDDFSVSFFKIIFRTNRYFSFQITNDNGILVISNELKIDTKMSSTLWLKALEKFDREVDLNSMTKKEVNRNQLIEICLLVLF